MLGCAVGYRVTALEKSDRPLWAVYARCMKAAPAAIAARGRRAVRGHQRSVDAVVQFGRPMCRSPSLNGRSAASKLRTALPQRGQYETFDTAA
jgi:hypothetical protein